MVIDYILWSIGFICHIALGVFVAIPALYGIITFINKKFLLS